VSSEGSVTGHLKRLKSGDQAAAQLLWQRYFQRLVRVARRKLTAKARRAADEEDIALSAFARFCERAEQGYLPNVRDRDGLWQLLVTLTVRMAIDQARLESRKKRGGPAAKGGALPAGGADGPEVASPLHAPDFLVQIAEECDRLVGALGDEELKSIARWKADGYTNEEIAVKLGCVLRTVERKIKAIRQHWSSED
jgi:DNA-directed RNA polymerase specialized sigma24 family protein